MPILRSILSKLIIFGAIGIAGAVGTVTATSAMGQINITNPELRYQCRFYNYDDSLLYVSEVEPTHDAVYRGNLPEKPATEYSTFEFTGWDTPLALITKDTNFHALYTEKRRDFTVKFVNYDGSVLYTTEVASGDSAFYPYENPTKPADAQYAYVFSGWDEPLQDVRKDTTFVAQYQRTKQQYKVYYFNFDETLLFTDTVFYGETSTYRGPSFSGPEAKPGYTYKFKQWNESTAQITADKAVIALFELERNKYSVTFYDHDDTVLYVDTVYYGDSAVYRGPRPYRPSDDEYSYEFVGWDKAFDTVKEDTAVYALYRATNPDCEVVFKNYDGSILESHVVKYNGDVVYEGPTPEKPETEKYFYTFEGWDRETTFVHSSFDVYPIFEEHLKTYTITFLNYDESVLSKVEVPYGENAESYYDGEMPMRPQDENYTYQFKCWNEDISSIRKEMTVVALFEATPIEQNTGEEEEGTGGEHGHHGHPEGGGGGGGGPVEKVTVTYCNWNGEELDLDGTLVGRPSQYDSSKPLPTRPDDKKYKNYIFTSWSSDLSCVMEPMTVYAQYLIRDGLFDKYIVTFRNNDGTLLYECVCEENEMPTFPEGLTPKSKNPYDVFIGWDRELTRCSASYTVYAKYQKGFPPSGGGAEGGGGAGDVSGDVTGNFGWEPQDKKIGTLVTEYEGTIYLRERSFGNFVNNKWTAAAQYPSRSASFSPLSLTGDLASQTTLPSYNALIKFDDLHSVTPSPMYNISNPDADNDDAYASQNSKDFDFDYVPFELSAENYKKLIDADYSDPANIAYASDYADYVKKTYLTVTDEEKEFFTAFAAEHDLSVSSIADIVQTKVFISQYCKYNLKAENYPEDSNYAIYFVEMAREGICNNYATSLAILYRSLGLPARFTVGYMVGPSGGVEREINTKYAHAWTEVFLDGVGWVYVDGTGGSNNGDGGGGGSGGGGGDTPEQQETGNKFNPFGELKLKEPLLTINIDPVSSTKEYDGQQMEVVGSYEGEFLNEGDEISYNICNESADVGSHLTRAMPRILDKTGKDVTASYVGRVSLLYQSYTITKRSIEIQTGSASKLRDGKALSCAEYEILSGSLAEGHQIKVIKSTTLEGVGTTSNVFEEFQIVDEKDMVVTRNYRIVWHYGDLTIS